MKTADDGLWFRGNVGEWAVVDYEKLYELVSPVILEGKNIRNTCSEKIIKKWDWKESATVATIAALEQVRNK